MKKLFTFLIGMLVTANLFAASASTDILWVNPTTRIQGNRAVKMNNVTNEFTGTFTGDMAAGTNYNGANIQTGTVTSNQMDAATDAAYRYYPSSTSISWTAGTGLTNSGTSISVTGQLSAATIVSLGLADTALQPVSTQGLVTAAITNGLASITYVDLATQGLAGASAAWETNTYGYLMPALTFTFDSLWETNALDQLRPK
jgi:hypothetical protein